MALFLVLFWAAYAVVVTLMMELIEGSAIVFGALTVVLLLGTCFILYKTQNNRNGSSEAEAQSEEQMSLDAQKDLQFLAKNLHKAPLYFDRAYVRDGKPKWDTVGCNKAHFSRNEILTAKLNTLSEPKQAEFIEAFCQPS